VQPLCRRVYNVGYGMFPLAVGKMSVFLATSVRVPLRMSKSTDSITSEKHFTPSELAEAWNLSVQTIRSLFRNEPGVLKIGNTSSRRKRGYITLRIPKQVVERVHRRLSA
jgi:hypothetical protein